MWKADGYTGKVQSTIRFKDEKGKKPKYSNYLCRRMIPLLMFLGLGGIIARSMR